VIESFADRETDRIFRGRFSKRFPVEIQARARMCLERLDAATHPADLAAFPSMRLKRLKGSLRGRYSLRVNDQYRIVFNWKNDSAENVRLMDYH
jgi:proteic killer suppression protein